MHDDEAEIINPSQSNVQSSTELLESHHKNTVLKSFYPHPWLLAVVPPDLTVARFMLNALFTQTIEMPAS